MLFLLYLNNSSGTAKLQLFITFRSKNLQIEKRPAVFGDENIEYVVKNGYHY